MRLRNYALACLLALAVAPCLAACSTTTSNTYTAPDACYQDGALTGDSLILKAMPDPCLVKTTIVTAVVAGLTAGKINATEVSAVVVAVKAVLAAESPYSTLAGTISAKVDSKQIAAVLTIVSSTGLLDQMAGNTLLISACDKALLVKLCDAVLDSLAPYIEA